MMVDFSRGADAACRLVQEDDLGIEREGAGDIEQLLVALREAFRRLLQLAHKSEQTGDTLDDLPDGAILAQGPKSAFAHAEMSKLPRLRSSRRTLKCGKMLTSWNERAIPSRDNRSGSRRPCRVP